MKHSIHRLAIKLGNNPVLALKKIIQGGLILLFGILIVITADRVIAESIIQEIIALLGLIIAGAGALWALIGYLSISVFRIYNIIKRKD